MFTFNYTLNDEDYLEFNKFYYQEYNRTAKATPRMMFLCILVGVSVFLIMIGLQEHPLYSAAFRYSFFFCAAVFFILLILWNRIGVKFIIGIMKKQGKLPFGKEIRIHFDENSIHEISELMETKVNYVNIERIMESKCAIYFFQCNAGISCSTSHFRE